MASSALLMAGATLQAQPPQMPSPEFLRFLGSLVEHEGELIDPLQFENDVPEVVPVEMPDDADGAVAPSSRVEPEGGR